MSPVASSPEPVHLWLRAESKPMEHRSALTPTTAKTLLDHGFKITVERSPERIFDDAEFEQIGATLVESGSWPSAPQEAYVIGLKELPETPATPLPHTHIQFAHCYKGQADWDKVLARFPQGGGTLLDLEFLQDEKGRRVAAFGYHAGFAGAAVGLDTWAWQKTGKGRPTSKDASDFGAIKPYPNEDDLIAYVKTRVQEGVKANNGEFPRVMVMGALGRCGSGAVDLAQKVGIPDSHIVKWDLAETKDRQGPYAEIVESDVFVNCIYLSAKIPPFLTSDFINQNNVRKLSVVVDVSCDTTNPNNPIPIYKDYTYFSDPVLAADNISGHPLHVVAIDHLPTMLPREASESFSSALIPSILSLKERNAGQNPRVWKEAEALFNEKVQTLPAAMRQKA